MTKGRTFRPAQGLKKLTWAQVEMLDAAVAALCDLSAADEADFKLTLVIRNGNPRHFEHPVKMQQLRPGRVP